MRSLIATAGLVLCVATGAARGATLEEYLQAVRAGHPLFEKERMEKGIEEQHSERYRGGEDWLIESAPAFTHREPVQASPFDAERIDYLRLDASASRTFWGNGSNLSLFWKSDVTDQDLPGFEVAPGVEVPVGPSTWYTQTLGATWSLPLLRNRGGALNRLDYDLSRYDIDIAEAESQERREDFLLSVALRFLDWALADEQLRIARQRWDLAVEELERARRKRRENLIDEADVLRAEDAAHVARDANDRIDANWKALQAELASIAGLPSLMQGRPDYDLYAHEGAGEGEGRAARVLEHSRVLRALDEQRARLARLESGLAETSRPDLALRLTGILTGGDDDFGGALDVTHPDLTVGLEYRHPLGNTTARADVGEARLRRRQLDFARQDVALALESSALSIAVQIRELGDVLAGNRERIETARRKTVEENRVYERGRGEFTFVIQSRDNESIAKLAYAENAAFYHRLVLTYRALADELLPASDLK